MVREIRIYIEGGGADNFSRRRVRAGFARFLAPIERLARERKIRWQVIPCGSRSSAFEDFKLALETHPEARNVLLIDSEAAVSRSSWDHLRNHDRWDCRGLEGEECHLMVQMVESWLVADPEMLAQYFGAGFRANALPAGDDIEVVKKKDLVSGLARATEKAQKGKYHKIRHGPDLLERIRADVVRRRARHCDRLFTSLENLILGQV